MANKSYLEKLKDPRWQKKRLEILERDEWMCQLCYSTSDMLHVHHMVYTANEPWNEPSENLTTLCDKCHAAEHGLSEKAFKDLKLAFAKNGFSAYHVAQIAKAFREMGRFHIPDVMAEVLTMTLANGGILGILTETYFRSLKGGEDGK